MTTERYTTARVPFARALGAPSVIAGRYDGAELQRNSTRPGAYDALAHPSRYGARLVTPGAPATYPLFPIPTERSPLITAA